MKTSELTEILATAPSDAPVIVEVPGLGIIEIRKALIIGAKTNDPAVVLRTEQP